MRRVDEDRWLAARFAPRPARERLTALYALNYEIARAAEGASTSILGEMRLLWWREAITEIHEGAPPRAHPALIAYARAPLELAVWNEIIDAREADTRAAPFETWRDLDAYAAATAGGVMRLALVACASEAPAPLIKSAAQAWALAGLLRAAPFWASRGRTVLPAEHGGELEELRSRARAAHAQLQNQKLTAAAWPALGYAALVPAYLSAGAPSLLRRQLTLLSGAVRGAL